MERVNFLLGVFAGLAIVSLDEDVRCAHLFKLMGIHRNVGHDLGVPFLQFLLVDFYLRHDFLFD